MFRLVEAADLEKKGRLAVKKRKRKKMFDIFKKNDSQGHPRKKNA